MRRKRARVTARGLLAHKDAVCIFVRTKLCTQGCAGWELREGGGVRGAHSLVEAGKGCAQRRYTKRCTRALLRDSPYFKGRNCLLPGIMLNSRGLFACMCACALVLGRVKGENLLRPPDTRQPDLRPPDPRSAESRSLGLGMSSGHELWACLNAPSIWIMLLVVFLPCWGGQHGMLAA